METTADPRLGEQLDRSLLQHARADAVLDVVAAAVLEHDRLDPGALEQSRERQPGRPGTDDADLRAERLHSPSPEPATSWKTANALLAAGTPQ